VTFELFTAFDSWNFIFFLGWRVPSLPLLPDDCDSCERMESQGITPRGKVWAANETPSFYTADFNVQTTGAAIPDSSWPHKPKEFLFAPVTSELDGETRGEVYRLSRSGRGGGGSERRSPKLYQLVPLILCHWFNQHDRRDQSVPQSQPKKEINPLWHVHRFKGTLIRWTNQCERGLSISYFFFRVVSHIVWWNVN
jgi:hypothetical protein